MNLLKSELRYSTSFRHAKAMNKGESAVFANFYSRCVSSARILAIIVCPSVCVCVCVCHTPVLYQNGKT